MRNYMLALRSKSRLTAEWIANPHLRRQKYIVFAVLFYLLALLIYIHPILGHCGSRMMGVPGDQTGLVWRYMANPQPLWGGTNWTNAPYGENLWQPQLITGTLFYVPVWALAKISGPVCAYNVATSFGFLLSATVMFLFIMWLTRWRNFIGALLAGYVVAFNPYLLSKTPYHPSYVFCGIIIGILWALMALWRNARFRTASIVAVLTAATFYFDPYFPLLAFILGLGFFAGVFVYDLRQHGSLDRSLKPMKQLVLVVPLLMLLLSPVIYFKLHYNQEINAIVGSSRGSILADSLAYGARPIEYFLPAATNPLLPSAYYHYRLANVHGSSFGESTVYIGLIPLALALYFLYTTFVKAHKSKPTQQDLRQLGYIGLSVAIVAGLFSLPPQAHVFGVLVRFPSDIIIHVTTIWRAFARLFVVLQIGIAMMAAFGVWQLLASRRLARVRYWLAAAIFIGLFVEYLAYNPFHENFWSYDDTPKTYATIKNDPSIREIAEYPLLEAPRNYAFIYYLTYQSYHHKPMINSALSNSPQANVRASIMNLANWQTPGVLRALGVDRVVLHGKNLASSFANFEVNGDKSYDWPASNYVESLTIKPDIGKKDYALAIGRGFDGPSNYGYENVDYFMHQYGELDPVLMQQAKTRSSAMVRIEYYAFEKVPRRIDIKQAGKFVTTVYPTETKQVIEFTIDPNKSIDIYPQNPPKDYSFVVSNMEVE